MEYYNIYLKEENSILKEKEEEIKSDLLIYRKEERQFEYCVQQIKDKLLKRVSELESTLKNKYVGTLEIFNKHEELYQNNSIENVLNDEVHRKYIENNLSEIISFEELIKSISAFKCLLKIYDLLNSNKQVYSKLYELNRIDEFILQEVLKSKKLKALSKEFQINIGTEKKNNSSKQVIDKKASSSNNNLPPRKNKLRAIIKTFTDNEKYLLLHYCLIAVRDSINRNENWNYKFTIPDTEFVKIISICSNIKDFENLFLKEKPGDVTFYRRITEGPKYLEKSNQKFNRIKKINSLIDRLEKNKELGLDRTISFLKNINN
jgi:hypothetical protein